MRRVAVLCSFAFVSFLLSGCAASSKSPKSTASSAKTNLKVDVVTQQEITQAEISKTPRNFLLTYYENTYAWERAKLFFKENTTSFLGERKISPSKLLLSNIESEKDIYVYEVQRTETPDGFKYEVTCFFNEMKGEDKSDLHARNLARFIREGKLEASL